MTKRLNPKAVIAVDLFGQAADYEIIKSIAFMHDLLVLEDAAQSLGGTYAGKKNCAIGCAAATSFSSANPLGCYGDGGLCLLVTKICRWLSALCACTAGAWINSTMCGLGLTGGSIPCRLAILSCTALKIFLWA